MSTDPITLEVIRNRLIAASRDIRRTIERAAYSPILYEVVDFSCGVLDGDGNLIADTPGYWDQTKAKEVATQIQAAEEAKTAGWCLWNPAGVYAEEGFAAKKP